MANLNKDMLAKFLALEAAEEEEKLVD